MSGVSNGGVRSSIESPDGQNRSRSGGEAPNCSAKGGAGGAGAVKPRAHRAEPGSEGREGAEAAGNRVDVQL